MKFKKVMMGLVALGGSIFALSSCNLSSFLKDATFTKGTTDYYGPAASGTISTYSKLNSDIRYIDPESIMSILFYEITGSEDGYTIDRSETTLKISFTDIYDKDNSILFDADDNTVTLSSYNFYSYSTKEITTTQKELYYETTSLDDTESEIKYDLDDYGLDIEATSSSILLPIPIASLILAVPSMYNFYYTPYNTSYNSSSEGTLLSYQGSFDSSPYYQRLQKTYRGNTSPLEERELTLSYIELFMDQFYGLKEYKGLNDVDDIIDDLSSYKDDILSTTTNTYQQATCDYFLTHLNDCHTNITSLSIYNSNMSLSTDSYGEKYKQIFNNYETYLNTRTNVVNNNTDVKELVYKESSGFPFSRTTSYSFAKVYGDTAIITFDSFTYTNKSNITLAYKYGESDTYTYMYYAFKQINEYNSENNDVIKNVVLDLSCNTGGAVISLFEALSFMTNDKLEWKYDYLSQNNYAKTSFMVDNDLDGDFTDEDAYTNFNYYVLTSDVTFSAANLFAAKVKELGIAKTIGIKSSGGMCVIGYVVLPDGTAISCSSSMQNVVKNSSGEYIGVEDGVDVDYKVESISEVYDYNNLVNTIIPSLE